MRIHAEALTCVSVAGPRDECHCLVTPPISPQAQFGMIVIESDHSPPMSGSNLICTVTAVLESGMLPMHSPITTLCVDMPAGLVEVDAECSNGKCRRVSFHNVPSFVMH